MKRFKQFLMEKEYLPYDWYRDWKVGKDGRLYTDDYPINPDEREEGDNWVPYSNDEFSWTPPENLGVLYGAPGAESFTPQGWNPVPTNPIGLPTTNTSAPANPQ
jgi:hypothetical protein